MDKFTGSLEELQAKVASSGFKGEWAEIAHGHQFRSTDGARLNWFVSRGTLQYQGNQEAALKLMTMLSSTEISTSLMPLSEKQKVFIVHGHDTQALDQLELILLKLELKPFILANSGGGGLTIIEALEQEIVKPGTRAHFGIVLLTPDDMGWAKSGGEVTCQPRARQNVVLEMGMLIGALGRTNVAILKRGHLESPSDAQGIIYLAFDKHVKDTVTKLVNRLTHAGFVITPEAINRANL